MPALPKHNKFFLGYYQFDELIRRLTPKLMRNKIIVEQIERVVSASKKLFQKGLSVKGVQKVIYEKAGSIHLLGIVRGGLPVALTLSDELNNQISEEIKKRLGKAKTVNYEINVGAASASRTQFGSTKLGTLVIDNDITAKRPFKQARKGDVVIIADDLVDDGVTMKEMKNHLTKDKRRFKIITATPIVKTQRNFEPDAFTIEIPKNWWVVFPTSRREHGKTPLAVMRKEINFYSSKKRVNQHR